MGHLVSLGSKYMNQVAFDDLACWDSSSIFYGEGLFTSLSSLAKHLGLV